MAHRMTDEGADTRLSVDMDHPLLLDRGPQMARFQYLNRVVRVKRSWQTGYHGPI